MELLKSTAARRFTATLAATATALALMTAIAVPARADSRNDDFAKALAALAGIAIVGTALNNGNTRHTTEVHQPRYKEVHQPRYKTVPQRHHRATVLPAQCAVEVRGRRHSSIAYIERCLRRSGIDQRLPRQCEVAVHMRGRDRAAYDQNCLLNAGFRTQRRGRY